MPSTYTPIATQTLGSAASSVTFSSISGTYTDLVIISTCAVTSGSANLMLRVNSDSGANYSNTYLFGDGSTAGSARDSNDAEIHLTYYGFLTTALSEISIANVMNYSNTTTYKTVLSRGNNAANGTTANVGLWRNTAAITAINLRPDASTFIAGSTFTLYGVKSA